MKTPIDGSVGWAPPRDLNVGREHGLAAVRTDRIVFWGLLALIAWVPLPLASNRPLAWSFLSLLAGGLAVVWAVGALARPDPVKLGWRRTVWAAVPFGVAVGWALLQASPYTPDAWHATVWSETTRLLAGASGGSISIDPTASVEGAMRMLAYGVVFWIAAQYGGTRSDARRILWCIALAGAAYAAYGLAVYLSGDATILGEPKWAFANDLTSTFVARASYGAYAGIGLLTTLALMADLALKTLRRRDRGELAGSRMIEALPPAFHALAFVAILLATALALTHSRGAVAVTAVGVAILFGALAMRLRGRRGVIAAGALASLVVGLVVMEISGRQTMGRAVQLFDQDSGRTAIHRIAWRAVADAPFAGHGLDTFPKAFYRHRDEAYPGSAVRVDKAHSVYLELLVELGIIGTAALFTSLAVVVGTIAAGVKRRRRNVVLPALGLSATALLAIHGLADFSIQMPAVAVTWAALLGVAYAQSWPSGDRTG